MTSLARQDRKEIFGQLKKLLKEYEPPFVARSDSRSCYELVSIKEAIFRGKKRTEWYFASVVIQADYVGFYFMPIYVDAPVRKTLKKELLSTLKGKACFHIRKTDPTLLRQIAQALKAGYAAYRKRGWA